MGPSLAYFMLGLSPDPAVYFVHLLAVYLMGEHGMVSLCILHEVISFFFAALAYGLLAMAAANSLPTFEVAQALVSSLAAILMLYGGACSESSVAPSRFINSFHPQPDAGKGFLARSLKVRVLGGRLYNGSMAYHHALLPHLLCFPRSAGGVALGQHDRPRRLHASRRSAAPHPLRGWRCSRLPQSRISDAARCNPSRPLRAHE